MNKLSIIFLVFLPFLSQGQEEIEDRWFSTIELDLVIPYEGRYDYGFENKGQTVDLKTKFSPGALYSFNYILSNKFSLGAVTGTQWHFNPDFQMVKLGGVVRYHFVDVDNVYIYLQNLANFSLNKDRFKNGNNFRFGLGFPIWKNNGSSIISNLFFEQNYLNLKGSESLLFQVEDPGNIYFKSFGISLGYKF